MAKCNELTPLPFKGLSVLDLTSYSQMLEAVSELGTLSFTYLKLL